ncbi:hypothetical protein HK098_001187 [Nowakowskiella sp. JEL0407]|nr:hypothetical protein HK098_001187 [Nowakowskiella sp. JEL0407]
MTASDKQTLIDMGFLPAVVEKALKMTKNSGLQPAMDWILAHPDDDGSMDPTPEPAGMEGKTNPNFLSIRDSIDTFVDEGEITADQATAQSLKCDECQKLFKDASKAEFHAMKTGHASFSESTEAIKPLTPEEKAQKLKELQERLKLKKEQKRLEELQEEKEKEKVRRSSAREVMELKEKYKAIEMQKAVESARREKEADKIARAKILASIEEDKKARAAKREKERLAQSGNQAPLAAEPQSSSTPVSVPAITKDYTDARLQIRKPDGIVTHTFKATDTLSVVYDFLATQVPGEFKLVTNFPRKVLADRSQTLKDLGLVPSAALTVQM